MTGSLWPICRLTLLITALWMGLAFVTMLDECYGNGNSCTAFITQYEQQHQIPEGLLHAISRVESGRKNHRGQITSWPWTVNAEGQGFFFSTKEEAMLAVQALQKRGVKSIDVGCMQVNLYHHPYAFKSLEEAFDPHKNVAYAAQFLRNLRREHLSWQKAMAHYHSANPHHNVPYQKLVLAAWKRQGNTKEKMLAMEAPATNLKRLHRIGRTTPTPRLQKVALATTASSSAPNSRLPVQRVTRNSGARLIKF